MKNMMGLMAQYLVFGLFSFFSHLCAIYPLSFYNSSSFVNHLCSSEDSVALLRFKNSLSIDNSTLPAFCRDDSANFPDGYPKTESWMEDTDCCSWDGVTCDRLTGNVIGLDLTSSWLVGTIHHDNTLFNLRHLQILNLACNDFIESEISPRLGEFSKLRHLNFSSSDFSGLVPTEISHLSKLVSFDLSGSVDLRINQQTLDELLKNVTELKHLTLDCVDMSSVDPRSLANLSTSLIFLSLHYCKLQGKFPVEVFHLPLLHQLEVSENEALTGKLPDTIANVRYLEVLKLYKNNFTGQVPTSLSHLEQLTWLDLSFNKFSGELSDVFDNLSRITHVNLLGNNFFGQFPSSIFNLTRLSYLDFSFNRLLSGSLPHQISDLPYLTHLGLRGNSLTGQLPPWLFDMSSLKKLLLGGNSLTGTIKQPQQLNSSLEVVNLTSNELYGPFPNFLFKLKDLSHLDLSFNKLSGILRAEMLVNPKNLHNVELSGNSILITTTADVNFTLPNLVAFSCVSCNLTEIPSFLIRAKNLKILSLDDNSILGRICSSDIEAWPYLSFLGLSRNYLTSFQFNISLASLSILDLSSNMLQGPLMDLPHSIMFFSISQNKLIGEIPSSFCSLSFILSLDLSNNTLNGTIPQCLGNSTNLFHLNLEMNNFNGSIPQSFLKGSQLIYLILNDNQLEGPLPQSLINCTELEVLDVRNNKISDTFPHWLATLQHLRVLVLQSNKFYDTIGNPRTRFPFLKLQILDISHNEFIGPLPTSLFENFRAMMNVNGNIYEGMYMFDGSRYYQLTISMKGVNTQMVKILQLFTTIDFSNNQFEGSIPEVVGNLKSLIVLNISNNNLTGPIPHSLGNLTAAESLDLSSNKLIGKIPMQLASLTYLEAFNVSHNKLVGHVPQGSQIQTFDNSSFVGNLDLCGFPLTKECDNDTVEFVPSTSNEAEHDDTWEWFWKIVMMSYGSGFVIGVSIAYTVFTTGRPFWIIKMYERIRQRWRNVRRPRERRRGGRIN